MRRTVAALGITLVAAGCQSLLGIEDTSAEGDAGVDADARDGTDAAPPPAGFRLDALPLAFFVPLDGALALPVTVARDPGFDDAINVSIVGAPAGMTFDDATIAPGQTNGRVVLRAAAPLAIDVELTVQVVATAGTETESGDVSLTVTGAPGTLDTAFGELGILDNITQGGSGTSLLAMAQLANGKIVFTGFGVGLAKFSATGRMLAGGQLDTGFNGTGIRSENFDAGSSASSEGRGLIVQQTTKLLMVGSVAAGNGDVAMVRFDADGQPDPEFGGLGRSRVDLGGDERVLAVVADGGDDVAVAGSRDGEVFFARFTDAGAARTEVGDGAGFATFDFTGQQDEAVAVHKDLATGEYLLLCHSLGPSPETSVVRLSATGELVTSFGRGGRAILPGERSALGFVVDATGAIYVAGHAAGVYVAKLDAAGSPVMSFGVSGTAAVEPPGATNPELQAIGITDLGEIILAGEADDIGFWIGNMRQDGAPEPLFGTNGFATVNIAARFLTSLLILDGRRVLLAAEGNNGGDLIALVARVWI